MSAVFSFLATFGRSCLCCCFKFWYAAEVSELKHLMLSRLLPLVCEMGQTNHKPSDTVILKLRDFIGSFVYIVSRQPQFYTQTTSVEGVFSLWIGDHLFYFSADVNIWDVKTDLIFYPSCRCRIAWQFWCVTWNQPRWEESCPRRWSCAPAHPTRLKSLILQVEQYQATGSLSRDSQVIMVQLIKRCPTKSDELVA